MGKVGAADVKPQVKVKAPAREQAPSPPALAAQGPAPQAGWAARPNAMDSAAVKARMGESSAFAPGLARTRPVQAEKLSEELSVRDLFNPAQRAALASVSQNNPVSDRLQNANFICGGASLVAVMIHRSTRPELAQANAEALRSAFARAPGEGLSPMDRARVGQALDRLATGLMSKEDVAYLQQAAYAVGRAVPGEQKTPGLTAGALATMVADLAGSGAALGQDVSFSQAFDGEGGHWVAEAGNTFVNTGTGGAAKVRRADIALDAEPFSARVRLLPSGDVQLQTRYRRSEMAGNGSGWEATITPTDPRNEVTRALKGNDKLLDAGMKAAAEGPLSR